MKSAAQLAFASHTEALAVQGKAVEASLQDLVGNLHAQFGTIEQRLQVLEATALEGQAALQRDRERQQQRQQLQQRQLLQQEQ